jgi:hypothetical protein
VTKDQYKVNEQAMKALAQDEDLYHRGGELAHIIRTVKTEKDPFKVKRSEGVPQIRVLPAALLRERLTKYAYFWKRGGKKQQVPTHPPGWCVAATHERGEWEGIRYLNGITTVPLLRPDGSLVTERGYDEDTQVLYLPDSSATVDVPDIPTREQVKFAVAMLLDLIVDFPFVAQLDMSVWLAMHLTQLCRYTFHGCVPLFLFDGNAPGVGKGLLVNVSSNIVYGRDAAVRGWSSSDEEMRKVFTSLAKKGDPLILLDNILTPLGGSALERALTATEWGDRLLGVNEDVDLPWRSVIAATGNNVKLAHETPRRVLRARLVTDVEKPEERNGFLHPYLLDYVSRKRRKLLAAGFTILRGWFAADQPDMELEAWGSFEEWSRMVRNAIVWAGEYTGIDLPDPCLSRSDLTKSACSEQDDLVVVLQEIHKMDPHGRGVLVTELVDRAIIHKHDDCQVLWDVFKRRWPGPTVEEPVRIGSVAMVLFHNKGRVVAGMKLEQTENSSSRSKRWRVCLTGG